MEISDELNDAKLVAAMRAFHWFVYLTSTSNAAHSRFIQFLIGISNVGTGYFDSFQNQHLIESSYYSVSTHAVF